MDPERWTHVDKLLQSALDRPAAERDAFVRDACAGDDALERELRSLVAAHDRADGFLAAPAIDLAARRAVTHTDTDHLVAVTRRLDDQQAAGGLQVGRIRALTRIDPAATSSSLQLRPHIIWR